MISRLKALRVARKLTLKQLAGRMGGGVHFTTVGRLERGEMELTPMWAERLAKGLDATVAEVMGLENANTEFRIPVRRLEPHKRPRQVPVDQHYDLFPTSEHAFIAPIESFDGCSQPEGFLEYALIDPNYRQIEVGGVYAFMTEDGLHHVGTYADRPPRFETRPYAPRGGEFPFGERFLRLEGRCLYFIRFPAGGDDLPNPQIPVE